MDFDNNVPIYIQVIDKVKQDLVNGKLKLGDKMPSTRDFALEIGINLNTVARVYKDLEALGLVFTKRGLGTYITEDKGKIDSIRKDMAEKIIRDFTTGMKNIGFSNEEIITIISEELKKEV